MQAIYIFINRYAGRLGIAAPTWPLHRPFQTDRARKGLGETLIGVSATKGHRTSRRKGSTLALGRKRTNSGTRTKYGPMAERGVRIHLGGSQS